MSSYHDVGREPDREVGFFSMIRMQVKSVMCVPLVSKAEISGVIYVHSLRTALGFTKEDLFFLTALEQPCGFGD